jgi:DMSO/TMAO reductase YedYZ molybdopterin-dependent catalytic subunit
MRPSQTELVSTSRRGFLRVAAAATAWSAAPPRDATAAQRGLIVRSSRPLDAETPVSEFVHYLTPNDHFFVRSHLSVPAVVLAPWTVEIGGEVERPQTLDLAEIARLKQVTVTAVLQCAGNGRAYFEPKIPGVGWERGAVGNAEWTGVRLRDVLKRAGIRPGAAHVHLLGADRPPNPKTPAFLRSIPLEQALAPEVLLAIRMNGEPLPTAQGGPIRLVVPGWYGNHWMKWVRRISVEREMADGFYMQTAYRIPKVPAPPGAEVKPQDLDYVTRMNVKSLIVAPEPHAILSRRPVEIRGVAWTGSGKVTRVDVATAEDAPWRPAEFVGPDRPFAWRPWRLVWEPSAPGPYVLRARAGDSQGDVQPDQTPWNRSGYSWNSIERVPCEVRPT